jgi:hypothetical protein
MKHGIGTPVGVMTMERPRPLIFSPLSEQPTGQCSRCRGRFEGWNGGICGACQRTGR